MKQPIPNKANAVAELTDGEPSEARKRGPIKLLVIAFIFTGAALTWLSWSTYDLYAHNTIIEARVGHARELRGTIIHLDEVLTMAARMAAATGDPQWEARYRRFEPQLNQAIEEISSLTPSQMLDQTNAANMRLVEMENRAFSLVRGNQAQKARAVLFSEEYEQQKEKYALGMNSFLEQLHIQLEARQRSEYRRALFSVEAGIVVLGVLLLIWLAITRRMYKAHAILLSNITRREQTEEVLRKAQRDLEVRVQERTADLTLANTSLEGQIIERASAEAALRDSEELHRDLFENANDIIYTVDLAGNYTSVNKACEKMVGYTKAEALTMNVTQVIAPEYLEQTRAMLGRQNDENSTAYELEIIAKNGHRLTLEVNSRLTHCDGKPSGVQGMARNITDRKRAEAERQAITEIVQGVLTTSNLDELFSLAHQTISHCLPAENCFIALYDKATDHLHIPFFKDQFDPSPAPQKVGRGLTAFVLRSRRPMLLRPELIQELALTGEIELFGTLPAAWLGVPLRTSTDMIGLLVVQDYEDKDAYNEQDLELLTSVADQLGLAIERKQIEVELKTNEMQLTAAQQIAHIGNWEWDVIKKNLGWSEELFRIFGFPPRDSGPTVAEFFAHVHPEDVKLVKIAIKEALRHGVISSFIFRIVRPDQTVRVLQMNGEVRTDENGRSTRLWGTIQDITERNRAETERDVISEVIQSVNLTSNIDELLAQVHQSLKKVLYAENCFVALFDKQDGLFEAPLFVDLVEANPFPVALSKNCIAKVFSSGQPLLMNQAIFAGLLARGEVDLVGKPVRSFLAVPLMTPAETVGVIVVQHYEKENVYSQRDVEFLSAVAAQLALAIERKRAEQALIESDRRFRDLFYDAPVGYHEIDTEGRITCVNTTELLMLGYSSAEMIGHHVWEFIEEAEVARATFAEKLAGTKPLRSVERSFRRKDGTLLEVQLDDQMLHDPSGRIIGIRATMQDIGERKDLEITLRQSEEKYRELIENANDIIYTIDLSGGFTSINRAGERMTGYTREEALHMNIADVIRPEDVDRVRQRIAKNLAGAGAPDFELEIFAKDGSSVTMDISSRLILQDGVVVGIQGIGRDITERKQVDEKLRDSEEKYRSLLENIPDVTWTTDEKGNTVFISANVEAVYGFTSDELVNDEKQRWLERIHPDDMERVLAGYHSLFAERKPYDVEFRIQRKDGVWIWLNDRARRPYEKGGVLYADGVFSDITERKRIDEELKTNETRMSEAQRIAHLGSWEYDAATGAAKWSSELWRIFGLDQREFGLTFEECLALVHPDDRERVRRIGEESQQSKKDFGYDYRINQPDGTVRVFRANGRIICDEQGQILKIKGTDQDITEQKRIEEDLTNSELQLVEAQHMALIGNWEWDIATNKTSWSAALYSIYGIKPEDLVPSFEGYLGFVHPDDRERVAGDVTNVLSDLQGCVYQHRIIRPDKSVRHHHVNVKVTVGDDGQPIKLFGTAQDITDRVGLENELKEARDVALESARLKSEFLANMSHEIRTPMNGVIGMTGLLLDSDLDTEQTEFAETIRTSGEALLTIINDILDFSKIEAGKLQFEMLDFDLSNVVEDTLELLAGRAHAKHIELASLIHSDVPHLLRGDPGRLRQVLTNLIGNALKFTERGEVVVRAEKDLETESDIVIRFTVTDTGIGISEAAQKNLFLAFTQADGSTTRKYGGTGLGLAISKQLVELMGGAIGVSSTEGKGSTFWFTAKFDKQQTQVDSIGTDVLSLDRLRALIVDDNATNRKILSHQLDSWGMVHEEAESGVRALEILRSAAADGKPYDLAILDFMMPVMDGFELARTIKSDASIPALPMVLLTSFGQRGDGAVARKAGIAAYLTKPVRQSQLFDCLANVMSQASGRPAPAVPGSALVTKHTLAEANVSSSKLILVAEDNVVNQKVAVRQLQKLGYRADTVADGRAALEALGRISYDLVLMDCQMPQMDGYEATAEIRLREGNAKHTPVVAMTAHALEGDRAKCIAAGMDEYIAKPVSREELQRVLELFFKDREAEPLDETRESGESLVDVARMHEMMGNEAHEFSEILDLYLDETAKSLIKLDAALALGDHFEVESIAHSCAGTSANCGMTAVAIPFRELEAAGKADRLKTAPPALAKAHKVFAQTRDFLAQHCAETVRPPSLNL